MVKKARNSEPKKSSKPLPQVVNKKLENRLQLSTTSNVPVRTLVFVEIGDLPNNELNKVAEIIASSYAGNHPVFLCPLRHGQLTSAPLFENDILKFIKQFVTVENGQLALKGGPIQSVDVKSYFV